MLEETDPLGRKTEYAYNAQNQLVEITDARGGKKALAYTASGQLASYTDCSGKTSSWTYDERDRLIASSNALGETTRYEYERGQLATVIHPDGRREALAYDAEGRLLQHTDPLGRLITLTNENAAQWRFEYNRIGQLVRETGFDQKQTLYHYDEHSGVLAHVDDNGIRTSLLFDAMGRLTERSAGPIMVSGAPQAQALDEHGVPLNAITESFAYDASGRLILAENAGSQLQWYYNEVGNLVREHQHYRLRGSAFTAIWRHEYDALDNRVTTIRPDGHRIDWLSYGSGHVHGLLLDGQEQVGFERDDLHREIRRTFGTADRGQLAASRSYDPAGRLTEQLLERVQALSQTAGQAGGQPSPNPTNATVSHRQYQEQ